MSANDNSIDIHSLFILRIQYGLACTLECALDSLVTDLTGDVLRLPHCYQNGEYRSWLFVANWINLIH